MCVFEIHDFASRRTLQPEESSWQGAGSPSKRYIVVHSRRRNCSKITKYKSLLKTPTSMYQDVKPISDVIPQMPKSNVYPKWHVFPERYECKGACSEAIWDAEELLIRSFWLIDCNYRPRLRSMYKEKQTQNFPPTQCSMTPWRTRSIALCPSGFFVFFVCFYVHSVLSDDFRYE